MKKMKQKVLAVLLCAACAASLAVPAFADGEVQDAPVSETEHAEEAQEEETQAAETESKKALEAAGSEDEGETYSLVIREAEHGNVFFYEEPKEVMEKSFKAGEMVTLEVLPEEGFVPKRVAAVHDSVMEAFKSNEDGLFEMAMPSSDAVVEADFEEMPEITDETDEEAEVLEGKTEEDLMQGEKMDSSAESEDGKQAQEEKESDTDEPEEPEIEAEQSEAEKESETEEDPAEESEEEMLEAKTAEPAASTRILVKTDDPELLDEEAVIGAMNDVYLLQYDTKEEAGDALASYEEKAEFAAEDLVICAADYGEFATGDPDAEIVMTEEANPFVDAGTAVPVAASRPLIALIDTGVSTAKEVSGWYTVLEEDIYDGNGHGDAMYDTIRGFDPKAEVVSIKALDNAGMGTVSSLYAAIRMAIDMQASVINLSLSAYSMEENEAIASIIKEAAAGGITVVGAAGNNGADAGSYIPANIPEAVIAAACNKNGERLPSSNYGDTVDLFVVAGSSSYAAATLSGIISATGGVPGPDGMAVFAPSGAVAADDYVDGLCYDGMSGNFHAAGVSYTIHNEGGRRLSDVIPGLTYESLRNWLGSHENDDYYLGTPYPERIVNGVPQYILGRSGDCDNRNPNGDCGEIHGNDDYAGVAMMNCTGFVWHALWKASGLSYTDGINRIPAWGGIGAGAWKNFIQNNGLEYMTVKSGGSGEINQMLDMAMHTAKDSNGNIFMEKGDIIWFWVDQIPLGSDDLPVNGYFGGLADKAHTGIYWPATDSNDNRWWDSIGICEYHGEDGVYLRNMLHAFTPKTGSVAMTVIKLGRDSKPKLTKVNVQKTSANTAMTDGNSCYSLKGAKFAVYKNQSNASAMIDPVTTFTTDETGYGESEEVLEIGKEYYLREIEAPTNGSFLLDPTIYSVKTKEADQVTKETAIKAPETPANDPAYLAIEKITSDGVPVKEAKPLSGTQFTIRYYKGEYAKPSDLPKPDKTWVIETKKQSDGAYRAYLLPTYKVSGDDFYFLSGNPDPVLPLGTVTIEETKAAEGYRLDNSYKNGSTSGSGVYLTVIKKNGDAVALTYGNTAIAEDGFTASDTPISGGVKIQKLDGDMKLDKDGKPYAEGDKSLAGAEFTITSKNDYTVKNKDGKNVAKGGVMQVIKTDANGLAATGDHDLPYGTYEIKETKASAGYKINTSWVKTFSVTGDGKYAELISAEDACYEPDIKGGVKIQKLDGDMKLEMDGKPYAEGDKNLAGAEFTITNRSAHAVKNKDGKIVEAGGVVQVIKTDANGIAQTGKTDLPYGTYEITETKPSAGYKLNSTWKKTFTIRKDGEVTEFTSAADACYEPDIKGGVMIQKLDGDMKLDYDGTPYAEGDKSLEGAEFTICNKSAHAVKNKDGQIIEKDGVMQVIKTDAMGVAKTGSTDLPYGTYEITETKASTGYKVNNSWKKTFSIREDGKIVELTGEADACYEPDIKGGVKIQKLDADIRLEMDEKPYAEGDKTLAGAEFTITNRSAHAVKNKDGKIIEAGGVVQVIVTDANGVAKTGKADLPYGTYEITETKPSEGYKLNSEWKKSFTVRTDGEVTEFTSEADACYEPDIKGGVQVQKLDRELNKAEAIGAASLGGITYQIINSSKHAAKNKDGVIVEAGGVMQEITTDKTGLAKTGETDLPYGTYTLHEITVDDLELSANDSYLSEGAVDVTFCIREDGKIVTADKDGKDITFANQVKRNDLDFRKVEEGSDRSMGSIPFVIEAVTTGEKHVIVTDGNGMYSSTKYAHSRDTNANDHLLDDYTEETVIKDADLVYKTGTWFGLGQAGTMAEVNDDLPAFPYGKYTITELRCEANEGYALIKNYPFVIEEDASETGGEKLSLNNLHDIPILPEIKTMALSDKTNDHILCAEENAGITDLVSCRNLVKGRSYVLIATLMDESTENAVRIPDENGKRIKVTGETAFTAEEGSMSVPVPITLDARSLAGKKLVVFEQLFLVDEEGEKTSVADHKEIADEDQSLTIPDAKTTFRDADTGSQIGRISTEQKVEDTVQYTGLLPGKEYSVTATVMTVDEEGKPVTLKNKAGDAFTKSLTFTPEKSDGSIKVEFVIDSSLLAGKKAVCFEEIRYGEIPVAIHADITDEDQTIWYPEIRTTATDKTTGDHVASVSKNGVFTDTVSYSGLKPGETYTAKAVLMDAETGEAIKEGGKEVTAQTVFTPEESSGEITVEIPVNTEAIAGKKTVVFEELFIKNKAGKEDNEKEETPVAEHKDLADEGQQVSIPEIRTTLTDDRTESHTASYGEKVSLTDTVSYKGLLPGKEYRLEAALMTVTESRAETEAKDADGNPIKAEKTFTAKASEGEETVTFTVNTALLAGKKAVCFETLYLEEIKLAVHADITDEDQSVTVPSIRTTAWDAVTGKHVASEGNTVIVDTISYTGLTPGASYRVKGSLMDAETGKPISAGFLKKVTGEVDFKPETAEGTVDVSFAVETGKLAGVTTAVFEELYLVRDGKEIPVAEHKDLADTDQQVKIPELKTTAAVKGEKACIAGEDTELIDTVSYRGLVPNETYILKGKLIDKESGQPISVNGKPITGEKSFTAVSERGTEEMIFVFDSTLLAGKTVVVFEDLYITNAEEKEVKIASHADAKDADQSVKIDSPEKEKAPTPTPLTPQSVTPAPAGRTSVSAPRTGDSSHWKLYALLLGGAAAAGIGLFIAKKRKNKNV